MLWGEINTKGMISHSPPLGIGMALTGAFHWYQNEFLIKGLAT